MAGARVHDARVGCSALCSAIVFVDLLLCIVLLMMTVVLAAFIHSVRLGRFMGVVTVENGSDLRGCFDSGRRFQRMDRSILDNFVPKEIACEAFLR